MILDPKEASLFIKVQKERNNTMYKLKGTIKCPTRLKDDFLKKLKNLGKTATDTEIEYGAFIQESRLYWDYVYPEMLDDETSVHYITFMCDDTNEGREEMHNIEWHIGWVPLNICYVYMEE